MKASRKSGGIKGLFLAHCEKMLTLLVVAGAGYLVYLAMGIEGETRRPDELRNQVQASRTLYQNSSWDDVDAENKKIAYDVGTGAVERVPSEVYTASKAGWSKPVVPPTVDRVDPPLLAALDVEGVGVTGLMAFIDEDIQRERELERMRQEEERRRQQERSRNDQDDPLRGGPSQMMRGGADPDGKKGRRPAPRTAQQGLALQGDELVNRVSCAIVLAKAPSLDQYNAYKEVLEGARGYSSVRDVPRYLGYTVERAEVRDGEQLEWKRVPLTDGKGDKKSAAVSATKIDDMTEDWAGFGEPLMDIMYDHPVLTMPLPPLVGQELGVNAIHGEVPLQSESDAKLLEEQNKSIEEEPASEEDDENPDFFAQNNRDMRGGMEGMTGRRPGRGAMGPGGRGMMGGMRGMMMEGMGPGGEMGMGPMSSGRGGMGRRPGGGSEFSTDVPFKMLRFYDFTVQPGRQYRYRIRLVLEDVNQAVGVERKLLAPEAVARIQANSKRRYRLTEWSEPSTLVSVPMEGDVFIVDAKAPGKLANSEGTLELMVQSFTLDEDDRAVKGEYIQSFNRGSVMNLTKDVEVISSDRRWIEKHDDFRFRTGITLCDFYGGEEVSRGISMPVKALLMDASGRLSVRNQLDDANAVQLHRDTFEEQKDSNSFGRGGRGGREFGGPMPGEDFGF